VVTSVDVSGPARKTLPKKVVAVVLVQCSIESCVQSLYIYIYIYNGLTSLCTVYNGRKERGGKNDGRPDVWTRLLH
jgi:hypothetical protein